MINWNAPLQPPGVAPAEFLEEHPDGYLKGTVGYECVRVAGELEQRFEEIAAEFPGLTAAAIVEMWKRRVEERLYAGFSAAATSYSLS